jgi:hypothetical protein
MKQTAAGITLIFVLCGGVSLDFAERMDSKAVARESLERLRMAAAENTAAKAYVGACVAAIAVAGRSERQMRPLADSVRVAWYEAAGRCRALASLACDGVEAQRLVDPARTGSNPHAPRRTSSGGPSATLT